MATRAFAPASGMLETRRTLGQGTYGTVTLEQCQASERAFAVKLPIGVSRSRLLLTTIYRGKRRTIAIQTQDRFNPFSSLTRVSINVSTKPNLLIFMRHYIHRAR